MLNNNQVAEYEITHNSLGNFNQEIYTVNQLEKSAKTVTYKKPQIKIDFAKVAEAEAWANELHSMMGGE